MAPRETAQFSVATDMSKGLLLQMQQQKPRPLLQLQIAPLEDPSHSIEFTQEKALACGLLLSNDTKAAPPQARSA